MPFYRDRLHPFFSRARYQKNAICLEPVVKTYQMGKFSQIGLSFSPIFVFWSKLLTDFFRDRVSFGGENPEQGKKLCRGHNPVQI